MRINLYLQRIYSFIALSVKDNILQKPLASRIVLRHQGFTLLELLLVIAIISVLATIGLSLYAQQAETIKINRTATQLEQILQAGTAFYTDNGCWPDAANCVKIVQSFNNYLTNKNLKNPWAKNAYKYQATSDYLKFQAWVTVPSENIANQIVALMPNAQITTCNNNGCTVIAEAPAPGIGYVPLNQNYQIMDIGNVTIKVTDNDDTTKGIGIPFFSCPTGWIPKVSTMIQSIEPKKVGSRLCLTTSPHRLWNYPVSNIIMNTPVCTQPAPHVCTIDVNLNSKVASDKYLCSTYETDALGTVIMKYVSYCCKPDATNSDKCAAPN